MLFLFALALVCVAGLTIRFPAVATVLWILALETSPDDWLAALIGGHETIIAVLKAAGLIIAVLMALRFGVKTDRWNPAFAFIAMFIAGIAHGLYPGLDVTGSLRSLVGSAAPFAFGFIRLPAHWCRAVMRAAIFGPAFTIGFGLILASLGLHSVYDIEQGAIRLGASGQPPFLAGFTLVAIYAGLLEVCAGRTSWQFAWLALNFLILLLTGARAPLALAAILILGVLAFQRRIFALAAAGLLLCAAIIFAGFLHFVRVVDLVQLGETASLSNRDLVWPLFEKAFFASPWIGWGAGAGKVIVPVTSSLNHLIGTNAAHNEYLRIGVEGGALGLASLILLLIAWVVRNSRHLAKPQRWLMRAVLAAFAIHSATDNTLIATTSSVLFIWMSAVFATAPEPSKAPA